MPQLLNFVVDSLDVRILSLSALASHIPETIQKFRLHIAKFENGDEPLTIDIPGLGNFSLLHYSTRPYDFTLVNPTIADIRIWNPDKNATAVSTQTGQLYVNFRSQFLQEFTIDAVQPALYALKTWFFDDPNASGFTRVSRADLAADVAYRDLEWSDLDKFVTKARKLDTFAVDQLQAQLQTAIELIKAPPLDNKGASNSISQAIENLEKVQKALTRGLSDAEPSRVVSTTTPQTIYMGRFGGHLYARIYNKTASLYAQKKEYMRDIWVTAGWDGITPVIRTEFSLSGEFLKNTELLGMCDHRDLDWFLKVVPNLWQYLTKIWLRHTDPTSDKTRSRWRSSDFWTEVQTACDSAPQIERAQTPRCTLEQPLMSGLKGYFTSLVSNSFLMPQTIYDVAVEQLFKLSVWIESKEFLSDLADKRLILGTDDNSIECLIDFYDDAELSSMYRREVMSRGQGS